MQHKSRLCDGLFTKLKVYAAGPEHPQKAHPPKAMAA
jgi:ribosomal protein L13